MLEDHSDCGQQKILLWLNKLYLMFGKKNTEYCETEEKKGWDKGPIVFVCVYFGLP